MLTTCPAFALPCPALTPLDMQIHGPFARPHSACSPSCIVHGGQASCHLLSHQPHHARMGAKPHATCFTSRIMGSSLLWTYCGHDLISSLHSHVISCSQSDSSMSSTGFLDSVMALISSKRVSTSRLMGLVSPWSMLRHCCRQEGGRGESWG